MRKNDYIILALVVVCCTLRPETAVSQKKGRNTLSAAPASTQQGKEYIFRPQMVYPVNSGARQLNGGFELRFSLDSIFCYLPYYGTAYNAAYGSSNDVLHFGTTDFDYKEQQNKKGERTIVLKPRNRKEIREINITLYPGGDAYVWINFSQRQNIAYRGPVITEP
jgi:hypothetical protein